MTTLDTSTIREALEAAGLEIYRARDEEIEIAERVRLHIMDSGVRVVLGSAPTVRFTARSQRSDFPNSSAEELFDRVRAVVGSEALARGFVEKETRVHSVTDPVDDARVLDVWHEVVYDKPVAQLAELVDEVRWAVGVEKYIAADS